MKEAHDKGTPVMRPCFYDFPKDPMCWEVEDQYMFGEKYLCAPVLELKQRTRKVYLPTGYRWFKSEQEVDGKGHEYQGGQTVEVDCPIESMPIFIRQ